jgi:hypothetical protein
MPYIEQFQPKVYILVLKSTHFCTQTRTFLYLKKHIFVPKDEQLVEQ